MTDELTLADAIAEVKRRFVRDRPWGSCDIDVLSIQYYGPSIARILNAVVSGELVPPATECPFGDDCDLTVAYMAGAASKKTASMMTASQLAADDDATIARLTEELAKMRRADEMLQSLYEIAKNRAEEAEAKLSEARASGTYAQGIEACREALGTLLVQANGVEPQDAKLRQNVVRIASAALALSPTPQADPVREPTEAMLNAARDWSARKYGKPIGNDAAIGCWQAMYDDLAGEQP